MPLTLRVKLQNGIDRVAGLCISMMHVVLMWSADQFELGPSRLSFLGSNYQCILAPIAAVVAHFVMPAGFGEHSDQNRCAPCSHRQKMLGINPSVMNHTAHQYHHPHVTTCHNHNQLHCDPTHNRSGCGQQPPLCARTSNLEAHNCTIQPNSQA